MLPPCRPPHRRSREGASRFLRTITSLSTQEKGDEPDSAQGVVLHSVENRLTLHGESAYTPWRIGLHSTLCKTEACSLCLSSLFPWTISPPLSPADKRSERLPLLCCRSAHILHRQARPLLLEHRLRLGGEQPLPRRHHQDTAHPALHLNLLQPRLRLLGRRPRGEDSAITRNAARNSEGRKASLLHETMRKTSVKEKFFTLSLSSLRILLYLCPKYIINLT